MAYDDRHRERIRPDSTPGTLAPMQDPNYKRLFSFPRMVEDLLRGFLPGSWLAEVDFSTLQKLPTEYVSDELLQRHGDCVWRLRRRGQWLYLLVLPVVLYTGEARWRAAVEVGELIAPVGPELAPYQPSQRYLVESFPIRR